MPRWAIVWAIIRRDVVAYFSNPTGYIFITAFVALGAFVAFWPDAFFGANLANLDTLTAQFPTLLLFFVPAITMGAWADERRGGTEELLLTLPATELELVAGKYGAALCNYAIALAFSLTYVFVLFTLGTPDVGLLLATYFGYLMLGASLISFGMIGSLFAGSPTVGFIYGALLCAAAVWFEGLGTILTDPGTAWNRFFIEGSVLYPFREAANGVITLQTVCTAVTTIGVMLFLGVVVLAARRRGTLSPHGPLRFVAAGTLGLCCSIAASRLAARLDLTVERLNTLTDTTYAVLEELSADQPVYVRAFVSPDVPQEYVETRKKLLQTLREYDARAGGAIVLEVRPTEPFSEAAREAEEQYGIQAQEVTAERGGSASFDRIYLGVALTSGAERVIVPFMHKRYSPEYELTRALRVVSRTKRPRLGLLTTDAKITGGFDFQSMRQNPEWAIVGELRQQYEVVEVSPESDYPTDLNVLLAVQPSSLTQPQLDRLQAYVTGGKPTVVVEDPLPRLNPSLSANEPKGAGRNPFMGGQPPPEQKGDFDAFARAIGVRIHTHEIVWDQFNPHPRIGVIPREIVFVGDGNGAKHPFNPDESITSGMQEVVALWPGHVERASDSVVFTPLISTGASAGVHRYERLVAKSFMGFAGLNPLPTTTPSGRAYVLAALAKGTIRAADANAPSREVNVCVVADVDMISDAFFQFRQSGPEDFNFDNVAFILNCIDHLAGDDRFVELRRRRARHRRLARIERQVKQFEDAADRQIREAEEQADTELSERQTKLNERVDEIRKRKDLDERQKQIMVRQASETEQRKFDVAKKQIEDTKQRTTYLARTELEEHRRGVQNFFRLIALLFPPVPALLLGMCVFGMRYAREKDITR